MASVDINKYSEQSVHFFSRFVPEILQKLLEELKTPLTIVDIGCGDGQLVWALRQKKLIAGNFNVIGVDISSIRLSRFTNLTGFPGILANESDISVLPGASADLLINTMVIEHVPNDLAFAHELARITKPDGRLYLSTVVRKPYAWYFRKAPDGRRVLDPTHIREYSSADQVVRMIETAGFVVIEQNLTRLIFPLAHLVVRWLNAKWPIRNVQYYFLGRFRKYLELIAIPIPRYRAIELIAKLKKPENRASSNIGSAMSTCSVNIDK